MLCRLSLTVVLVAVVAASADAQIVSNPVVTSWPPYTTMRTYPLPSAPPVAADVCTPPVVTYYSPTVPARSFPRRSRAVVAPTTTYYAGTQLCVPPVRYAADDGLLRTHDGVQGTGE